ncbi:minor tail protein [Mycobacterium phage WIVsmall]|uniref:minor tail protein n=1 Tax=Mycobacterium phage WIVsmall TaxID=1327036 RepID=UPI00032B6C33|nr:minor tail protein [Mycobacterium phage WIVsmall]AGK88193.1 hypothetical protein WIVsmall_57 [Mycobacterium phage WIVsmall]
MALKDDWGNGDQYSAEDQNDVADAVNALEIEVAGKADSAHNHSAGDITSGTLSIDRIPTGSSGSTVCIGNDSRLSNTRTPTDNTVSTAKIQDGAVTTAKIGDGQVTSAKIADGTIVNADISASAAIAKTKLDSGTQTSLGLADNSVQKSGSATGLWMGSTLPGSGTAGVLYVVTP